MRIGFVVLSTLAVVACGDPRAPSEQRSPAESPVPDASEVEAPTAALAAGVTPGAECLHDDKPAGAHDGDCAEGEAPPDGAQGHFGAPFALAQPKPLAQVIESYASIGETPVQVSGEVDAVCQKKGCWMVIKDGDATARVLMKDHAFAVPFDGKGKKAVVEGTVKAKELSEAQVKHIEEDAGRDPGAVSGTRNEYILTASGIRLDS